MDSFFQQYLASHPVNATFTGVHAHDRQLPDWSQTGVTRMQAELEELRVALEAGLPRDIADDRALAADPILLDSVLALANIQIRLLELNSEHFQSRNPALWTGEAIFGTVSLMIREFATPDERLSSMAARLAAVPRFLHDIRHRIVLPIPERWRDRAMRECNTAAQLFDAGLEAWIHERFPISNAAAHSHDIPTVRDAAVQARAAFADARRWLDGCAIADEDAYAIGESLFAEIVACGHFCDEAPRALLSRAENELRRERANALLDNWAHTQDAIAADHPTINSYYASFDRRWHEIHKAVVASGAVNWPDWPIRYMPIPAWAQTAAPQLYWLFYRSPAPFDNYSTYEYLVAPIDDTMPEEEQQRRLSAWNHSTITLQSCGAPRWRRASRAELMPFIAARHALVQWPPSIAPVASECSSADRWRKGGHATQPNLWTNWDCSRRWNAFRNNTHAFANCHAP